MSSRMNSRDTRCGARTVQTKRRRRKSSLERLASSDPKVRRSGAFALFDHALAALGPDHDSSDRLAAGLAVEWKKQGRNGVRLVKPLVATLTQDRSLIVMEGAAMSLATQGAEGLSALLALIDHEDFAIRQKVAVAIGLAGHSARWAAPILDHALRVEPVWLVTVNLLQSLGRIGGPHASKTLASFMAWVEQEAPDDEPLRQAAMASLAEAQLTDALA